MRIRIYFLTAGLGLARLAALSAADNPQTGPITDNVGHVGQSAFRVNDLETETLSTSGKAEVRGGQTNYGGLNLWMYPSNAISGSLRFWHNGVEKMRVQTGNGYALYDPVNDLPAMAWNSTLKWWSFMGNVDLYNHLTVESNIVTTMGKFIGDGSGLTWPASHWPAKPAVVIFEGDSLTSASAPGKYPEWLTNAFEWTGFDFITNAAVAGATIADVDNRWTNNVVPFIPAAPDTGMLLAWMGANSFLDGQPVGVLSNYYARAKAAGLQVVAFTILPRVAYQTEAGLSNLFALNQFIRTSDLPDWTIDVAAEFPDCYNAANFSDGTHLTTNAAFRVAQLVNAAVKGPRHAPARTQSQYGRQQTWFSTTGSPVFSVNTPTHAARVNGSLYASDGVQNAASFAPLLPYDGLSSYALAMNAQTYQSISASNDVYLNQAVSPPGSIVVRVTPQPGCNPAIYFPTNWTVAAPGVWAVAGERYRVTVTNGTFGMLKVVAYGMENRDIVVSYEVGLNPVPPVEYSPLKIASLRGWWLPNDLTTNGTMLLWPDRSINGYNLTNLDAAASWPVKGANTLNSRAVISFPGGANSYFRSENYTNGSMQHELWMVLSYTNKTGNGVFFEGATNGATVRNAAYISGDNVVTYCNNSYGGSVHMPTNQWIVFRVLFDHLNSKIWTNNVVAVTDPLAYGGTAGITVGAGRTLQTPVNFDLAEMATFSAPLDAPSAAALWNAWTNKYNITP